ncbi:MAG: methyltransferase [Oscillospiraceae bacterium]|nr:methyltransferase [Oscillospiraceae bacterium]
MEHLPGGFTLQLPPSAFPLSTDSMVLAHFVRLPRDARVLDLGSGCGTLGLTLCAIHPGCTVTGVELDEAAHQAALENISRNGLQGRLSSICADLRSLSPELTSGSFHCCVSNPPYFSGGPASRTHATARQEGCCTPADLMAAAAKALKFGGDFFLVHKPEKLAQLIACAAPHHLEAKRLRLIRHKEGGPISLILLQFRKGGKPGLIWDEHCLYTSAGEETPYFREVYHI